MVWFSCEDCGDSIKKPKLQAHLGRCPASRLTCIDCNMTFSQRDAKAHNTCVTEHQKYAEGATKPGGMIGSGPTTNGGLLDRSNEVQGTTVGAEFLATSWPWKCRLCNVSCTSQDTLQGHASGLKHIKKVKAAQVKAGVVKDGTTGQETKTQPGPATAAKKLPVEETREASAGDLAVQAKKKKRKSILEMPEEQEIRLDADIQNGQLSKKAKHKESAQNVEEDIEEDLHNGDPGIMTWKKASWEALAVACLKKQSLTKFSKLRRKVLRKSNCPLDAFEDFDKFLLKIVKSSPLLSFDGSSVRLR